MSKDKCEVKGCRHTQDLSVFGVWLCEQHYDQLMDGFDVETIRGKFRQQSGELVFVARQ